MSNETAAPHWQPFTGADATEEGIIRFGVAEFLYLLLAERTESGLISAEKYAIDEQLANDRVRFAGASGLVSRGYLETRDGNVFVPQGEAALIAHAANHAEAWITVGVLSDEADDVLVGMLSAGMLVVAAPDALQSFGVTMVPAGDRLLDVVGMLVEGRLDTPKGVVFVEVEFAGEGRSRVLFVRHHALLRDAYEVALGERTRERPPILPEPQSDEQLDALLAELLRVDAETGAPVGGAATEA